MYLGAMIILKKQTEVTFFLCPLVLKIMTYKRASKKMKKGLGFSKSILPSYSLQQAHGCQLGSLGIIQVANFPSAYSSQSQPCLVGRTRPNGHL
jgi:hypothetical protein